MHIVKLAIHNQAPQFMFADNFNGYYPTVMRSLLRRVLRAERDAVPPDEHIDTFHKGGGGWLMPSGAAAW